MNVTRTPLLIRLILVAVMSVLSYFLYLSFNEDPPDAPTFDIYDVNQDGKTNSLDCDIAYDIMQGARIATPSMLERCDINGDGLVDDADVYLICDAILYGSAT